MDRRRLGRANRKTTRWMMKLNFQYQLQRRIENQTDVFFFSFPKSGRSWLRVMLGKYLCIKFQLPDRYIVDTWKLTRKTKAMNTLFSHRGIETVLNNRFSMDPSRYKSKKVILLTRNMKDVLVSLYFQATKRMGFSSGEISDFLWGELSPVLGFIQYHNAWYEHRDIFRDFLHLTYEETHKNPGVVLARMLNFIGVEDIEEDILKEAVEFASFENMRKMEQGNRFKDARFKPGDLSDPESYKTRKGIVGGYGDYLSPDDVELMDLLAKKLGSPFVKP